MHEDKVIVVKEIRNSLYQIHKCLLDYQANLTSIKLERRLTPYDLWQFSVDHEDFDWLKKISALIVVMDEEMDSSEELADDVFNPMVNEITSLFFSPLDKDISFYEKVSVAKETGPTLLMALGELMQQLVVLVNHTEETKLSSQIQI